MSTESSKNLWSIASRILQYSSSKDIICALKKLFKIKIILAWSKILVQEKTKCRPSWFDIFTLEIIAACKKMFNFSNMDGIIQNYIKTCKQCIEGKKLPVHVFDNIW